MKLTPKDKKELLKDFPVEILLYVIYELGEYLIGDMNSSSEIPKETLEALNIGGAALSKSGIDFKKEEKDYYITEAIGMS